MLLLLALVQRTRAVATPARWAHVAAAYTPKRRHPSLFSPESVSDWIHPRFAEWLQEASSNDHTSCVSADGKESGLIAVDGLVRREAHEIYSFPLLSDETCTLLQEEIAHFQSSGLEARRPNSMNNYGIILNDIGLRESLSALQTLVQPLAAALFPVEAEGLDDHHSFVVQYQHGQDLGLDMHTDDSDVTLNVCLADEFKASGLTFCGDVGTPGHRDLSFQYQHVRGTGLLHLGRRRHGADDIEEGSRTNLIMWNYNRAYRASAAYRERMMRYEREAAPPDQLCVSYTHDRDWESIRATDRPGATSGRPPYAQQSWCPPLGKEYAGFEGVEGRYQKIDSFWKQEFGS